VTQGLGCGSCAAMAEKHKLFVGGLPVDCTQEELSIVFNTYGNAIDIHVMKGKSTSGQCCAFVSYDRADSAETAVATLDGVYSIREDAEKPISVKWAKPSEQRAAPAAPGPPAGGGYQAYGAPAYGAPAYGAAPGPPAYGAPAYGAYGQPRVVAPVVIAPARQAQYVAPVQSVVGSLLSYGDAPPPPPPPPGPPAAPQNTKVFVGNLPQDIQQDAIRMVFGTYGTVTNVHIMGGKSKSGQSCAFVEYSQVIEAETSILTLSDKYEIRPGEGPITVKYANNQQKGQQKGGPY